MFDAYLSDRAAQDVLALTNNERDVFEEAKRLLLVNPTETSPFVSDLGPASPFGDDAFLLVHGDIGLFFHFVNALVIEIVAVGRRRRG